VKTSKDKAWRTSFFYLIEFLKISLFIETKRATRIPPMPSRIYWFNGANIWNWSYPSVGKKIKSNEPIAKEGSPSSTGLILPSLKTPVLYWFHIAEKNTAMINTKTAGMTMQKSLTLMISRNCKVSKNEHKESTPWSNNMPKGLPVPFLSTKFTCLSCLLAIQIVHVLVDEDGNSHHHQFPSRHSWSIRATEHEQ